MKNKILIGVFNLVLLTISVSFSQNKMMTMEDVVLSAKKGFTPAKLDQLQWIPGTTTYSWVVKSDGTEQIMSASGSGKDSKIIDLNQLNIVLKKEIEDSLKALPSITWTNAGQFTFEHKDYLLAYRLKQNTVVRLLNLKDATGNNKEYNSKLTALAYTKGNNLFINTASGKIQVTNDSNTAIVSGQIVHREEFGIHKGTFWSPSGDLLAFYRMDQTMVTDYPIYELDEKPAAAKMVKYPMAGEKSHHVTIGVYNVTTEKTIWLKTGEPNEQYLTNIAWSPDNKKIYVVILNREQNHLKFNRYDAASGDFEVTLFEEKNDKYIQPLHPAIFSKNGSKFIWQSRRDGYNHIYLYDQSGKAIKQLTTGNWEVIDVAGFDGTEANVWFAAAKEKPTNKDIYSVNISSAKISRISSGEGTHKPLYNTEAGMVIDEFASVDVPKIISIKNKDGKELKQLLKASNPLKDFSPVNRNIFTIKNENGDELYCKMVTPQPFDSTKQYPVIVYVYGGPNVQLVSNNWPAGTDLWYNYMAQRGFIVFTLENRGTPFRGADFEQATFRQLGEVEMQDQISGVKWLMKQKFINKNRMGVYGWSYGGFMTVSLMTRHPGLFKAAVAGGPVIDWKYYEIMYTERYMDTPAENSSGYEKANLLNYVENLTGKMMLIHGTSDDVVVWQHSLLYLKKAVQKNIQLDYFVYPGHEHNVTGRDRTHLLNKISNYFFENLK
ncbi:MAG: DPP IV N-terminal domain-containing protein [Bacteroidetes bacterium]|nr:DPP IV N-terminal domain-containing protein [Bacteroidota bacterium]